MFGFIKNIFPQKIIGIDIGTHAIKIVEISSRGKQKKLENYSSVKSELVAKEPLISPQGVMQNDRIAKAIKEMLLEARIKTKSAIFSIPDFSTLCATFEIPPMSEKEIAGAVQFNAARYLTLPVSEVTLDWRVSLTGRGTSSSKVFVVAVPNQTVEDYKAIAHSAGLELNAVEAEVFAMSRAIAKDTLNCICVLDIGVQSSTINIIEKGFLRRSYTVSFSARQLSAQDQSASSTLASLAQEINSSITEFLQSEQKQIEEIYCTGGGAQMPGFVENLSKELGKKVSLPNSFDQVAYPSSLRETLRRLSSSFTVAVGAALDGLEI